MLIAEIFPYIYHARERVVIFILIVNFVYLFPNIDIILYFAERDYSREFTFT